MAPNHGEPPTYQVNPWSGLVIILFLAISMQSDLQEMWCLASNRISSCL